MNACRSDLRISGKSLNYFGFHLAPTVNIMMVIRIIKVINSVVVLILKKIWTGASSFSS